MKSLRNISSAMLAVFILTLTLTAQTDVTLDIGDVDYDAYTSDLLVPVTLNGPADAVAGVQFDILADPALVSLVAVTADDALTGFTADFSQLTSDINRVILFDPSMAVLPANGDTILWLQYAGTSISSAVIGIEIFSPVVSDTSGEILSTTVNDGSISIGSVVSLSLDAGTGDINEQVTLVLSMDNDDLVGGVQLDLADVPDYVTLDSAWTTVRTSGFTVSTSQVDGADRLILYSADNGTIAAGSGGIVNLRFLISPTAYANDVLVQLSNVTVTDAIGGTYWIAGLNPGIITVYPGYLEPPTGLVATSGLDSHVPLAWNPPLWTGGGGGELSEDFESGELPNGWTTTTNSLVGGWFVTQDGSSEYFPIPAHGWYACSNDDLADDDGSVDYLVTPAVDASTASAITLNFASFFPSDTHSASIEVSTDGENFTVVASMEAVTDWVDETVDLSAFAGESNLLIAFHSDDNAAWAYGWAVDDIQLTFSDAAGRQTQITHFDLSPAGEWLVTAEKASVVSRYPYGLANTIMLDYGSVISHDFTRNSRNLMAYNIYRSTTSPVELVPDNLLASRPATELAYDDTEVVNGNSYYYAVAADYGDMGVSGPSNEATGIPVEWVELSISGGAALTGQTDTLDIFLNNESDVSSFMVIVADLPDYLLTTEVLATPRTEGFIVDMMLPPDGTTQVIGTSFSGTIAPGNGPVARLVVRAAALEPATVNVDIIEAEVTDSYGNVMSWSQTGSTFDITVETQTVILSGAVGATGQATVSIMLNNTQDIHGFQLTIADDPNLITGLNVVPSGDVDLSNWLVGGDEVGGSYVVLASDMTLANPIEPGMHHIADITFMLPASPWGEIIDLSVAEVVLTDVNAIMLYTEVMGASVSIGYPDAVFSVTNLVGPGASGVGSFDINITNFTDVGSLVLELMDMPNSIIITGVNPVAGSPFSDALIDGSTGEMENGHGYIFAYQVGNSIGSTNQSILTVDYMLAPGASEDDIMVMIVDALAGDASGSPLNVMASGYMMISDPLATGSDEMPQPEKFALNGNYPNPFNPVTRIGYDLSELSLVKLVIYDMMGRQVRTLVNEVQQPGRMEVSWNGVDQSGRMVGAGVYLYRLQANSNTAVGKMILLK